MTDYHEISCDTADGILTITLSRPEALNAFTAVMATEMLAALDAADSDDNVRAVIVTGSGRGFCAGADLSAGGQTFDAEHRGQRLDEAARDGGGRVSLRIFESNKPVIAAINGPAVGVGITMTLPMDARLCSDTAKFGFVFTRRGIVPEAASSWFLPRLVGPSQAAEWFYTGRVFGPEEALAGRLVRSVHPAEDLLPAAGALANEMSEATSSISVALARQMMWRALTFATPYQSHVADSRAMHVTGRGADAIEGITAFLEKRAPAFPGRVSADLPDVFSDPQPSWAADLPL